MTGAPAYIIGALLMAPFPIGFVIGFAMGVKEGAAGGGNLRAFQGRAAILDIGLLIICVLAAVIVGAATAKSPKVQDRRRRLRDEEEEWDDVDFPQRRRDDRAEDWPHRADGPPDDRIRDRPE